MLKIIGLVLIVLVYSENLNAQKYALIDRGWKKPIRFVETYTKEDLAAGWYPIYESKLDSVILIVQSFKNLNEKGLKREYFNMLEYQVSTVEFHISNVNHAYGDRYDIDMISSTEGAKLALKLSDSKISNKDNELRIRKFIAYLKKHRNKI